MSNPARSDAESSPQSSPLCIAAMRTRATPAPQKKITTITDLDSRSLGKCLELIQTPLLKRAAHVSACLLSIAGCRRQPTPGPSRSEL